MDLYAFSDIRTRSRHCFVQVCPGPRSGQSLSAICDHVFPALRILCASFPSVNVFGFGGRPGGGMNSQLHQSKNSLTAAVPRALCSDQIFCNRSQVRFGPIQGRNATWYGARALENSFSRLITPRQYFSQLANTASACVSSSRLFGETVEFSSLRILRLQSKIDSANSGNGARD